MPACPLPLDAEGRWSERHHRALVRYYVEAGAGGIAVGVHTTQFEIREPEHGLMRPVLELVAAELGALAGGGKGEEPIVKIAGICGRLKQAFAEAQMAAELGYEAGLLSMGELHDLTEKEVIEHCRIIAKVIPVVGFYLQPTIGGRVFSYRFWRRFVEIPEVVAIKMAPFNRYQTWDVVRAVLESGRDEVALYTGNDDNIINDLLTPFRYRVNGEVRRRFVDGGLLGQWAVGTKRAVEMLKAIREERTKELIDPVWLERNVALTDANGVMFDAANDFAGCIPGIMEVLRRQGLVPSNRCLSPDVVLSPGQAAELDRIEEAYPFLHDNEFVRENLDRWLA